MHTELFTMTDEAGNPLWFVDSRNACGSLVASEPFTSLDAARDYLSTLNA